MSGRHSKSRRNRREVIDDHDAETIRLFRRINQPGRVVRQIVAKTLTETKSIDAALRMTRFLQRYLKAGAK